MFFLKKKNKILWRSYLPFQLVAVTLSKGVNPKSRPNRGEFTQGRGTLHKEAPGGLQPSAPAEGRRPPSLRRRRRPGCGSLEILGSYRTSGSVSSWTRRAMAPTCLSGDNTSPNLRGCRSVEMVVTGTGRFRMGRSVLGQWVCPSILGFAALRNLEKKESYITRTILSGCPGWTTPHYRPRLPNRAP